MPRTKVTRGNYKDHKVTVRLDDATYQTLKAAMERGAITNLSEALRGMIRQKLWEERVSERITQDLRLEKVKKKELESVIEAMVGNLYRGKKKEFLKADGFLEGFFSAFGRLLRTALAELERRESQEKITKR